MKITICVTVFNEEKNVTELFRSFLSQTRKPDEIVIVNGGSIDKTVQIIKHSQKKNQPPTQILFDFVESLHRFSAYLRTKSVIYSRLMNFIKVKLSK